MRGVAVLEIRLAQPDDEPFLWDMGWEATAVDAGMRALGREAAFAIPHARRYLDGLGTPRRCGSRRRRGWAATRRCLVPLFPAEEPGWGFVATDVPELSIGVISEVRGTGVGSALLDALLTLAREQGFRAVSLSVDRQNPARRLYERKGFRDAGISDSTDTSVTMIANL